MLSALWWIYKKDHHGIFDFFLLVTLVLVKASKNQFKHSGQDPLELFQYSYHLWLKHLYCIRFHCWSIRVTPQTTPGTLVVKNAYAGAVRVAAAVGELTSSTTTSCFDMGIIKNWLKKSNTMVIMAKRSLSPLCIIIGIVVTLFIGWNC